MPRASFARPSRPIAATSWCSPRPGAASAARAQRSSMRPPRSRRPVNAPATTASMPSCNVWRARRGVVLHGGVDRRAGGRPAVQHQPGVRPRRTGDRALSQDPPVRHHHAQRYRLPRERPLRARRGGGDVRCGRHPGGLRHLLRPPFLGAVRRLARPRRRTRAAAGGVHRRDRRGALGDADPRPRDRDAELVCGGPPPRAAISTARVSRVSRSVTA